MSTLTELSAQLKNGETTSRRLTEGCLLACEKRNPGLNAFLEIFAEEALALSDASDARRKAGKPLSPLDGIPAGIKDNFLWKRHIASCASRMLEDFAAPYSSAAVESLLAAGMIPLGRTNMDEFAMGSLGENSAFGPTLHPDCPQYSPGGSSSGSAAAVAAGLVPWALGSDTGGSVRCPAACCGITGVKPARETLSRRGLIAYASSLDSVGLLCQTPADAELLMDALCRPDPCDATCSPSLWTAGQTLPARWTVCVLTGTPESDFTHGFHRIPEKLSALGHKVISAPIPEDIAETYRIISCAEAASNLARYDGIRYGASAADGSCRTTFFGSEVKKRLTFGALCMENGAWERAIHSRRRITARFDRLLSHCDFLLCPTLPSLPPAQNPPMGGYKGDCLLSGANLAGLASVSVPVPLAGCSLCLTGKADSLPLLLEAAERLRTLG